MFTICLGVVSHNAMCYIITTIDQIWLYLFITKNENEITVFNEC